MRSTTDRRSLEDAIDRMARARTAVETARDAHTARRLSSDRMFRAIREYRQATLHVARLTSTIFPRSLEAAPTHEDHPNTRPGA